MKQKLFAFFAIAALLLGMSACTNDDNPSSGENGKSVIPAQLKQGIWTEYDEALLTSGKYTAEELAEMPAVGMQIDGDKAYFFTYTADDASEPVEGKISYNKSTGEGTITFPAIKDNPLSGQKVNFTATSDETMQFELTYEGQKTTATFAWLCENLDNWNTDITDADWKELMAYYELIAEDAGPDASIDWSDSEVKGLDEPLVWDEGATASARTRAIGIGTVISMGLKVLGALFEEEKPDPSVVINQKLDAIGGKLNNVLANQEIMMKRMDLQFDKVNDRLVEIAQKMKQTETVNIFNNRNEKYYYPLKVRINSYFDDAYKLYNDNKSDLSKVSSTLGEYGKEWVGNDEKYVELTWQYIEYLTSVRHSTYGTGMDRIYDGLTFEKYPWEHLGFGDRQSYRAYDMFMITKCLFMINLYATYGGLSDIRKNGLYKNYNTYKDKLKGFSEFKVANPDEFRVCQIPGAHFVMRKEIQKYNYYGENGKFPDPNLYGDHAIYRPEWHEAGSVKIDNPEELISKLIRCSEADAMFTYYSHLYPENFPIWWYMMLMEEGANNMGGNKMGAGAVFPKAQKPISSCLLLDRNKRSIAVGEHFNKVYVRNVGYPESGVIANEVIIEPVMMSKMSTGEVQSLHIGNADLNSHKWISYGSHIGYYAAIVEERY